MAKKHCPKYRQKYLKRYYGKLPASHIASVLGFKNATCLMEWCERRGITYCTVRHNYLSTRQLATLLGVNVSTIQKWAKKGLLPTHRGYKQDLPVHLFLHEEIEHWLMAPMPAWALLPVHKIQDERFRRVMENAQAYNANYWRPIQETADTLYTTRSNLKHHVNKGRIASRMLGGRRWVHYPDAVRVMQGEYG